MMYGDQGHHGRVSDQSKVATWRNHGSNAGRRRTFISSPRRSDRLWDAQYPIIRVHRRM